MYIEPFWLGVIATIVTEFLIIFGLTIFAVINYFNGNSRRNSNNRVVKYREY